MIEIDHPSDSIAEISLIGTGGGYGESCVIHLGNKNWIVVDSCFDPNENKFLPIKYLNEIDVDLKSNVKLIVCTHWDDDHIKGLSKILELCPNAKFVIARAHDRQKFLNFVSLDYQKLNKVASNSSSKEFLDCLTLLEERNSGPTEAIIDRLLLKAELNDGTFSEVISLSPSDFTVQQFDLEISTLITEFGNQARRLVYRSPNSRSIALFLKLGTHRAILGADLEVTKDTREGWLNILDNNLSIDQKSSLIKVSHHGSENGYHERIWLELLDKNPISKLTPWNKNNKLPTVEMLNKYCEHSDSLYMTSPVINDKPKKREPSMSKMIRRFNDTLREVKFNYGIVRSRIDLANAGAKWTVDLIGNALHVNSF